MARKELFLGCVDARNPLEFYGFSIPDMYVLRDMAAYKSSGDNDLEVALEYAINKAGVTDITVGGHSDCGAACACVEHEEHEKKLPVVMHHLSPLSPLVASLEVRYPDDPMARKRGLECNAVHETIENLRSYACVRKVEEKPQEEGGLRLHARLTDIKTGQMYELIKDAPVPAVDPDFPPHNPTMLLFGGMDPCTPVAALGIAKGQSLIVRNFGAFVKADHAATAAVLEFAIKAKGVQKIAIVLDTDCALVRACLESEPRSAAMTKYLKPIEKDLAAIYQQHPGGEQAQMHAIQKLILQRGLDNLQTYPSVRNAKKLILEAWLVDTDNKEKQVMQTVPIGASPRASGREESPYDRR